MKRRIVFLGPPASGKGTEAARLSERCSIPHVSTGEIFRQASQADTRLGRLAKQFIDNGELVPDEVVLTLVDQWMQTDGVGDGFIFDGFPRTLEQARLLDGRLAGMHKPVEVVIWLDPTVDVIVRRMEGRRVCPRCRCNYHVTRMPPKVAGRCDRCGGPLEQRPDDTREMVLKRLRIYQDHAQGLTDHYRNQGKLERIDGDLEHDEMFQEVLRAVA